jgi:hypothetical protein
VVLKKRKGVWPLGWNPKISFVRVPDTSNYNAKIFFIFILNNPAASLLIWNLKILIVLLACTLYYIIKSLNFQIEFALFVAIDIFIIHE